MNSLTIVGYTFVGFIIFLLVIFWSGLKRPVKSLAPDLPDVINAEQSANIREESIGMKRAHLPVPVRDHLVSVFPEGQPSTTTAVVWGIARYRISGLWMPLRYETWCQSGNAFLRHLTFFWHGKTIIKGIDFFLDSIGALQANGVIPMNESGKKVTESQWISFWAESLVLGLVDLDDDRLKWKEAETGSVLLELPPFSEKESCDACFLHLRFHAKTGRIETIKAQRYQGQLATERISWFLHVKKWHQHETNWIPEYTVRWGNQRKPWCHYRVDGIRRDVPVDEMFQQVKPHQYEKDRLQSKKRGKQRIKR
ncbi:DUF6544 family protein [Anoxynatronum buryatiense]|uniref:Uncharacterized protein n=1 Tax=Anoxynatronum buryatiense TaxID=489973 RepID=A0AA46AHY9_9CLOT|nr:DUF6544 family protein [Anoxynatronum buryatiense]SMP44887.1 hypothetical protein SAMN06296020_102250 [Anoxynatronum buryatiense]